MLILYMIYITSTKHHWHVFIEKKIALALNDATANLWLYIYASSLTAVLMYDVKVKTNDFNDVNFYVRGKPDKSNR